MTLVFNRIVESQFNIDFTYHADAILYYHFLDAAEQLDEIINDISLPIVELVRGGGGEAKGTQRLRKALARKEWKKDTFYVEKRINEERTFAQSHEVDHVGYCDNGTIALEIEWNNKDPFFDRDLENFNRLHADGAISIGIIVTRGDTFQEGIKERMRSFAANYNITSFADLEEYGISPTPRQRESVNAYMERHACDFARAWSTWFTSDKFGSATTHWQKLKARLDRGVGSPCPTVGIGIPLSRVTDPDST